MGTPPSLAQGPGRQHQNSLRSPALPWAVLLSISQCCSASACLVSVTGGGAVRVLTGQVRKLAASSSFPSVDSLPSALHADCYHSPPNTCLPCFLSSHCPFSAPLHSSALKERPRLLSFPEPHPHCPLPASRSPTTSVLSSPRSTSQSSPHVTRPGTAGHPLFPGLPGLYTLRFSS